LSHCQSEDRDRRTQTTKQIQTDAETYVHAESLALLRHCYPNSAAAAAVQLFIYDAIITQQLEVFSR